MRGLIKCRAAKNAGEDRVDMTEVLGEVKQGVKLGLIQVICNIIICL